MNILNKYYRTIKSIKYASDIEAVVTSKIEFIFNNVLTLRKMPRGNIIIHPVAD